MKRNPAIIRHLLENICNCKLVPQNVASETKAGIKLYEHDGHAPNW